MNFLGNFRSSNLSGSLQITSGLNLIKCPVSLHVIIKTQFSFKDYSPPSLAEGGIWGRRIEGTPSLFLTQHAPLLI